MKLLDCSLRDNISIELNPYADTTSIADSNLLDIHDHKRYTDVYGYDSKSRHKNITPVDAVVASNDP